MMDGLPKMSMTCYLSFNYMQISIIRNDADNELHVLCIIKRYTLYINIKITQMNSSVQLSKRSH